MSENRKVAMKIPTMKEHNVDDVKKDLMREILTMSKLDHPHVVQLLGISDSKSLSSYRPYMVELGSNQSEGRRVWREEREGGREGVEEREGGRDGESPEWGGLCFYSSSSSCAWKFFSRQISPIRQVK